MDEAKGNLGFARRVAYSLLRPAARVAASSGLPLKDFVQLSQLVLYEVKRGKGLSQRKIAQELDVSSRTLDRLLKDFRDGFFEPETSHELPRRIEFMLWAEPAGLARIAQVLSEFDPDDIEAALDLLIRDGRVEPVEGRTLKYAPTQRANRIMDTDLARRIDALNNVLQVLSEATQHRFIEDDTRASARTVAMRVRTEDLPELEKIYEELIWPRLVALDERASGDESAIDLGLTLLWTPIGGTDA